MNFFKGLFRFVGVLILLFVIVVLPLALFGRVLAGVIFSPDAIVGVIEDNLLDVELLASVAEQSVEARVAQGPAEPDIEQDPVNEMLLAGLGNLSHDEWVELIRLVAPPELVSETLREAVTSALAWIDNPNPYPAVTISTAGWKSSIETNMVPAFELVLNALPQCRPEEVLYFGLGLALGDSEGTLPLCRPPEPFYSDLLATTAQIIPAQLAVYPDQLNLGNRNVTTEATARMREMQRDLRLARFVLRWGWLAVLGLFALGVWFGARSWSQALKWIGRTLLFSSLLTVLIAVAIAGLSGVVIGRLGGGTFSEVPPALLLPMKEAAQAGLALLTGPMLLLGFLQLVLGVGGIIVGRRMAKKEAALSMSVPVRPEEETPTGMFG